MDAVKNRRRLRVASTVAAAGVVGSLVSGWPAFAFNPQPEPPGRAVVVGLPLASAPIHTPDWSGYQSRPTSSAASPSSRLLASAGTTFTVPTITCTGSGAGENFGLWGGTGGLPHYESAVVEAYCSGTTPVYRFYVQADGYHFTELGAHPGDVVVASFSQTGSWNEARIHDVTRNLSWAVAAVAPAQSTIAGVGVSRYPITEPSLAPFTTVAFMGTSVNGDDLGFQSPRATAWYRGTTALASPTVIDYGNSFAVRFQHR